jgi:thiol-disulfide isomerase/thioredoxin
MERVVVLVGLLAVATAFGLWWRSRNGRLAAPTPEPINITPVEATPADATPTDATPAGAPPVERALWPRLGFDPADAGVTLVQFSTAFCQPCRATRVILAEVAGARPGVRHVEVDAESHLDVVRALDIRRTPTVLLVDAAGRIVGRASGQPRKAEVVAAAAAVLGSES